MRECGLIVDGLLSGPWNMAVDETLLALAAEQRRLTLRFYQWSEPTLSLGYFQRSADRRQHAASRDCVVVRRSSGGGAIVHDRELTYALAMPVEGVPPSGARGLYDVMHDGLVTLLSRRRVAADRVVDEPRRNQSESFLCFERRSPGDVVLGGTKICGSAQRRKQGAILQHGSLILARSDAAPELPGLLELTGEAWSADELIQDWRQETASRLGVRLMPTTLSQDELTRVRTELFDRFDSGRWTHRR